MHAVFIPYGKWEWVNVFLNDIRAQKLTIRMHRKNPETGIEEEQHIHTNVQLRMLPGGLYECVFPREHKNIVLTALNFHRADKGHSDFDLEKEFSIMGFKIKPIDYLRKYLRLEEPGEFDSSKELVWDKYFVSVIPIGIREDKEDLMEKMGPFQGWWHEPI